MHSDCRFEVMTVSGVVLVSVDGEAWMSFDEDDIACRRLAMVQLAQRALGTHEQIASAFGLKSLSVDRYRKAFRQQGLPGLLPKKKGPKGPRGSSGKVDKVIIAGKRARQSPGPITAKRAVSRPAARDAVHNSGYRAEQRQSAIAVDDPPSRRAFRAYRP
jgi:hypothetical protein